jgi:hypothetical protein
MDEDKNHPLLNEEIEKIVSRLEAKIDSLIIALNKPNKEEEKKQEKNKFWAEMEKFL